jgi:hypothetical protein
MNLVLHTLAATTDIPSIVGGDNEHKYPAIIQYEYCVVFIVARSFFQSMMANSAGPQAAAGALAQFANPIIETEKCDATTRLILSGYVLRDEGIDEFTRLCEFKIAINNLSYKQGIWVVVFKHEVDIWQDLEKTEWQLFMKLEPLKTAEWMGYHSLSSDPDAMGPTYLRFEKIVGIYDIPECLFLREDEEALQVLAKEVPTVCLGY